MDYYSILSIFRFFVVSLYHNEEDALEAISKEAGSFHVAIVEVITLTTLAANFTKKIIRFHKSQLLQVTTSDNCGSFRFIEMAKDIPTIG